MAEFMTTNGICARLDEIMKEAEEELVLVSPFLDLSRNVIERLRTADRKGVKIDVVYGKKDPHDEVWENLESLNNVSVHFYEDLHAKCYFNEKELIITSMNLLDSSRKNREMGVCVERGDEDGIYRRAVAEAMSIMESSELVSIRGSEDALREMKPVVGETEDFLDSGRDTGNGSGFCIRCQNEISLNSDYPYCKGCYRTWAKYRNPEYEENWCHECGEPYRSTMVKPLCKRCYGKAHEPDMWDWMA